MQGGAYASVDSLMYIIGAILLLLQLFCAVVRTVKNINIIYKNNNGVVPLYLNDCGDSGIVKENYTFQKLFYIFSRSLIYLHCFNKWGFLEILYLV